MSSFKTFIRHGMKFKLMVSAPCPSLKTYLSLFCSFHSALQLHSPSSSLNTWCSRLPQDLPAALSKRPFWNSYHGLSSTPFSFSSNIISSKRSFLTTVSNTAPTTPISLCPIIFFSFLYNNVSSLKVELCLCPSLLGHCTKNSTWHIVGDQKGLLTFLHPRDWSKLK